MLFHRVARSSGGWAARLGGLILAAGALLLVLPASASAHAVPVSSTPAPGARLGAAPAAVVIVFDEPLEPGLSGTTVIDPAGRRFTGTVSGKTIRVPLSTSARGIYQVDWKTVSVVDGHTITGTFRFGVGVSPAVATTAVGTTAQGPTAGDGARAAPGAAGAGGGARGRAGGGGGGGPVRGCGGPWVVWGISVCLFLW